MVLMETQIAEPMVKESRDMGVYSEGEALDASTEASNASKRASSSSRGSRASRGSRGGGEELLDDAATDVLKMMHKEQIRLEKTFKAQLAVEQADRKELERMLQDSETKREAAEMQLAATRAEADAKRNAEVEQQRKEMDELKEQMKALMNNPVLPHRDSRDSSRTPTRSSASKRGHSVPQKAVRFHDEDDAAEVEKTSNQESQRWRLTSAISAVGGAVGATVTTVATGAVVGSLALGFLAKEVISGGTSSSSDGSHRRCHTRRHSTDGSMQRPKLDEGEDWENAD